MTDSIRFTDIHCHLAPQIDDGARSWDDTLAMARLAVDEGIGTIICTPHQLGNFSHNQPTAIRTRVAEVQRQLDAQQIPLKVLPGADVRIEPDLVGRIRRDEVLTLADRGQHVLLELPHEMYLPLEKLLAELHSARLVGILSHPERNEGILARPAVLGPLVDAGCLMQVTAGSLIGAFGNHVRQFAEGLVQQGMVHFISTDAHGPKSRRPLMRQAFARCVELAGQQAAMQMCCTHPALVAAGERVPPGRLGVTTKSKVGATVGGWFSRRRSA